MVQSDDRLIDIAVQVASEDRSLAAVSPSPHSASQDETELILPGQARYRA